MRVEKSGYKRLEEDEEVKAFKKKAEANVEAQFIFDSLERIVELLEEIRDKVK